MAKLSNAISPNNDRHNDVWLIPDMINYPEGTVLIFNRYGRRYLPKQAISNRLMADKMEKICQLVLTIT